MKRWPFITLAIASFTVAGVFAANEMTNADPGADAVVAVATLPPPPPHYAKLVLPRRGLFQSDALAQAEFAPASPLPLPQIQQNEAQAWITTSITGVTAVSASGDSAYAVIQTPGGSMIVRLGDVVAGRKVESITVCDPPKADCREGVMFDGGVFVPVGMNSAAQSPSMQVPQIGGAFPNRAVPVQAIPGATPAASPAPQAGPQVTPLPPALQQYVHLRPPQKPQQNPYITPQTTFPTPSFISPNNPQPSSTTEPR